MLRTYETEEAELLEQLRLFPNREWVETYLDLAKEVVDWVGPEMEGVKLVTAIVSDSTYKLHLTINYRIVLAAYPPSAREAEESMLFILRPKFDRLYGIDQLDHYWQYDRASNEKEDPSHMVKFYSIEEIPDLTYFKEEWKEAVIYELNRAKASSFKHWHSETAYRLIVERDYRKLLLDQVYNPKGV